MAGKLGLYVIRPEGVQPIIDRLNPGFLLLVDDALALAEANQPRYTIGRQMGCFPDNLMLLESALACYILGRMKGAELMAREGHHPVRAWMSINEFNPHNAVQAERYAAFEAGVAEWVHGSGKDYIGGNWATGNPEAAEVVAWIQAYRRYYHGPRPLDEALILGYHGYFDGKHTAADLELRPWTMWKPALDRAGIPMPKIIMTEGGIDLGWEVSPNGYRNEAIGSEFYARYLRGLPDLVPEALGYCLFCCGGTDDWK